MLCKNVVVIQVPSLGKDLVLFPVWTGRKHRKKGCRSIVQPVMIKMNQFLIRYRVNWTLIIVAILNNVCTDDNQPVHQDMIRSITTIEIVVANFERQAKRSLLRISQVKLLTKSNPEYSGPKAS